MDDQDIVISRKYIGLRIAAFIVASASAIFFITKGITGIGKKDNGYYLIRAVSDHEEVLNQDGISFYCYLQGSSSEINTQMKQIQQDYSKALIKYHQILDPSRTYENVVNLATLNQNLGQEIQVSSELYNILHDAYQKTAQGNGYNLFAGAYYQEWNGILILEDPEVFDPLVNEEERGRLDALRDQTGDYSLFSLQFLDDTNCTLRLDVDQKYLSLLRDLEIEPNVLDLNLMHDAYELELLSEELEEKGYTDGYLTSTNGLTTSLSRYQGGEYCLYGLQQGDAVLAALITAAAGSACSQFRAFGFPGMHEYGYYTLNIDGKQIFRNPYILLDRDSCDLLLSLAVVSQDGDVVNACYQTICLLNCANTDDLNIAGAAGDGFITAFLLQDSNDHKVYVHPSDEGLIQPATEYGYHIN
jgi:hypothetical protein